MFFPETPRQEEPQEDASLSTDAATGGGMLLPLITFRYPRMDGAGGGGICQRDEQDLFQGKKLGNPS